MKDRCLEKEKVLTLGFCRATKQTSEQHIQGKQSLTLRGYFRQPLVKRLSDDN